MKHGRHLPWLLAVVVALLLLRWLVPLHPAPSSLEVVSPTSHDPGASTVNQGRNAAPGEDQLVTPLPAPSTEAADLGLTLGNAFAVRRPKESVAASVHSSPVQAVQVAQQSIDTPPPQPPAPPPPEPPPLQVIGTWDDGAAPGVFIATPQSTVLARKDSVLMSDYRVVEINALGVSLLQLSSQRPWTLAIPQNAPPPRQTPIRSNP